MRKFHVFCEQQEILVRGISINPLALSLFSQNTVFMFHVACELAQGGRECSPNCCSSSSELDESFDHLNQTAVQGDCLTGLDFIKVFEILPKW